MPNLAMCLTGVPPGLRVTQVHDEHLDRATSVVRAVELAAFGRSEGNRTEMLAALRAPELHGRQGTAALWERGELVAVALAYEEFQHASAMGTDLFIHPDAPDRTRIATCVLAGVDAYAAALGAPAGTWLKSESFDGDTHVEAALAALGYTTHRVYLRMRLDFDVTPAPGSLPAGLTVRGMQEDDWPGLHAAFTSAFADHYDFHPLPFDVYREQAIDETSDLRQWRLVFDGSRCVGVCMGSNRYAAHALGYVDTLAVVREHRGRGIARFLLQDAFVRDAGRGFTGTALHCDATNPTGATALYESVGMREDQRYTAWRARSVGQRPGH